MPSTGTHGDDRAWSKRLFERQKAMPTKEQAGVYSDVLHYLKAVSAVQNKDPLAVIANTRDTPVHDFFAENGVLRPTVEWCTIFTLCR